MLKIMNVDRVTEQSEIEELFARASRMPKDRPGYSTKSDREYLASQRKDDGIKTFKRRALGLCGSNTVKNLDEMAQLLYETNIVDSIDEGRKLIPSLVGKVMQYSYGRKAIRFDEVENTSGQRAYRISLRVHQDSGIGW